MQKIISIFLSLLLLSSATGVAYGQHFCGEHLAKSMITFSESSLACGMEMEKTPASCELENGAKTSLHENDCCDNQLHQVETDDNFNGSQFTFNFNKNFIAVFVSVFVLKHPFKTISSNLEIVRYFPPPLDKDVQILYQVFLI